jgi:hypothetical protein
MRESKLFTKIVSTVRVTRKQLMEEEAHAAFPVMAGAFGILRTIWACSLEGYPLYAKIADLLKEKSLDEDTSRTTKLTEARKSLANDGNHWLWHVFPIWCLEFEETMDVDSNEVNQHVQKVVHDQRRSGSGPHQGKHMKKHDLYIHLQMLRRVVLDVLSLELFDVVHGLTSLPRFVVDSFHDVRTPHLQVFLTVLLFPTEIVLTVLVVLTATLYCFGISY